jgi:hypothetical protein
MPVALWALIIMAAFALLNLAWFRLYLRVYTRTMSVVRSNVIPIASYRGSKIPRGSTAPASHVL